MEIVLTILLTIAWLAVFIWSSDVIWGGARKLVLILCIFIWIIAVVFGLIFNPKVIMICLVVGLFLGGISWGGIPVNPRYQPSALSFFLPFLPATFAGGIYSILNMLL